MKDLGTLGGESSTAIAINDNGVVVGDAALPNTITHAFIWTEADGMVDLLPDAHTYSQARAINSAGDIAGLIGPGATTRPFYWTAIDGFRFIPLPKSASSGWNIAFGMNDASAVTGRFYSADGAAHGFVWLPQRRARELGSFGGGESIGVGINNRNHITGAASTRDGVYVAFIWDRFDGLREIAQITGSTYTSGNAINDNDEVVGSGAGSGFYWSSSTGSVLLQTLGGDIVIPTGINNNGQITGHCTNEENQYRAVIWADYTAAPQELGTLPGGFNSYSSGINNVGEVVGWADVP
jgi:probable HAF family extracellular repeat protein